MPNPFASLGSIDVMGTIQNMLQRQATLRDTQLLGDEREQTIALRKQEMEQRQRTLQVLAQDLQGGVTAGVDKGTLPSENDTPIAAAQKQVRQLERQFSQWSTAAKNIAGSGGTLEAANYYMKRAEEAQGKLTAAMRELRLEQKNQTKEMSNLATGITEENFGPRMEQLRAQDPSIDRKYTFDRDPSGNPIWGDKTVQTLNTIRDAGRSAQEQLTLDEKIKEDKIKTVEREQALKNKKLEEQKLDSEVVMARIDAERAKAGKPKLGHEGVPKQTEAEKEADAISKSAVVEPSEGMVKAAKASVEAFVSERYPNVKKDSTMNAFAQDVAARANVLRADALKKKQELSIEDARQQAMDILGQFLKTTAPVTGWFGSEKEPAKIVYRRAGVNSTTPVVKTPAGPAQPQTADEYLRSIGVQ
jgi:hypothetical protein